MPVRQTTLTTMLLASIDDRPATSVVAKDDLDNFAAEFGAAIVTGRSDFSALPFSRPAFKDASASSKDAPASSSKRRAARAGSAQMPEKNTLAQAPFALVLVPLAANDSSPDLSQTDTDSSITNAAQAIPQKATARSIVIPDAQAQAGVSITTIAGAQSAESPSGVAPKIKSSSQSDSSRQPAPPESNDPLMGQTSQAGVQPGQAEPDATAAANLASAAGAHSSSTQAQAGDSPVVAPTPVATVTAITRAPETATQHVANLKVDLNDAGSARATIRERAGEVDVKIVTPDSDSARHLVNEVNALRRSLDGAGLRLRNAEVVYRSDRYQNPQRDDSRQNSQQSGADSANIFTIEETNQ